MKFVFRKSVIDISSHLNIRKRLKGDIVFKIALPILGFAFAMNCLYMIWTQRRKQQ